VLTLTALGLAVAGRSFGWRAGLTSALLFWLYHIAGGAWQSGQRELLLALFLAWGTALAIRAIHGDDSRWLVLAGFCLGFAVWIKPYALLFFAAVLTLILAARGSGDFARHSSS